MYIIHCFYVELQLATTIENNFTVTLSTIDTALIFVFDMHVENVSIYIESKMN